MAFPSRACPRGVLRAPRDWNKPRTLPLLWWALPPGPGDAPHDLPALSWPGGSLGGVGLAIRSLGGLSRRPALPLAFEQSPPFPGYRTRELWDSSGVLNSLQFEGSPAVPPRSSADPSLSWTALLSQRGHSDPALTGPGSAGSAPRRGCEQSRKELVSFFRAPPRTQAPPAPLRAPGP